MNHRRISYRDGGTLVLVVSARRIRKKLSVWIAPEIEGEQDYLRIYEPCPELRPSAAREQTANSS